MPAGSILHCTALLVSCMHGWRQCLRKHMEPLQLHSIPAQLHVFLVLLWHSSGANSSWLGISPLLVTCTAIQSRVLMCLICRSEGKTLLRAQFHHVHSHQILFEQWRLIPSNTAIFSPASWNPSVYDTVVDGCLGSKSGCQGN